MLNTLTRQSICKLPLKQPLLLKKQCSGQILNIKKPFLPFSDRWYAKTHRSPYPAFWLLHKTHTLPFPPPFDLLYYPSQFQHTIAQLPYVSPGYRGRFPQQGWLYFHGADPTKRTKMPSGTLWRIHDPNALFWTHNGL